MRLMLLNDWCRIKLRGGISTPGSTTGGIAAAGSLPATMLPVERRRGCYQGEQHPDTLCLFEISRKA